MRFLKNVFRPLKESLDDIVNSKNPENLHHTIVSLFGDSKESVLEDSLRHFVDQLAIEDAIDYQVKITLKDFNLNDKTHHAISIAATLLMETLLPRKIEAALENALNEQLWSDEAPQKNFYELVRHICAKHPDIEFKHFRQLALADNQLLAAFNTFKHVSILNVNELPLVTFSKTLDALQMNSDAVPLQEFIEAQKGQASENVEEYLEILENIDPDFDPTQAQRILYKSLDSLDGAKASGIFSPSRQSASTTSTESSTDDDSADRSPQNS